MYQSSIGRLSLCYVLNEMFVGRLWTIITCLAVCGCVPPVAKPKGERKSVAEVSEHKTEEANPIQVVQKSARPVLPSSAFKDKHDWPQLGGTSERNNAPSTSGIPIEWTIEPEKTAKTRELPSTAGVIKWQSPLGSNTFCTPVVSTGKVFVGTNNAAGYLKRLPPAKDLGVLLCFNEADGTFLWQHSSEKLQTGRIHDWPLQGICGSPMVEGDRLWFVTSRGEVRCLDTDGFFDGEDDGRPEAEEPVRLFDVQLRNDPQKEAAKLLDGIEAGALSSQLLKHFHSAGIDISPARIEFDKTTSYQLKNLGGTNDSSQAPLHTKWIFRAIDEGVERHFVLELIGRLLSGYMLISPHDKNEADVVWVFDMMKELGTLQHKMCPCSVTAYHDILFVTTGNGTGGNHDSVPRPGSPSFIALDKFTGKLLWSDNSPGERILHGQWSSPAVAVLDGNAQVIFGGGDGWLYSFKASHEKEARWKCDLNPKDSVLAFDGRGTRNDIIATPVVNQGRVYIGTGQEPEHGPGKASLWCIDASKSGDISESLVIDGSPRVSDQQLRISMADASRGDRIEPNPNSGVLWKFDGYDANGDGQIDASEQLHRSISSVVVKDNYVIFPDISGRVFCLDAVTGRVHWRYECKSRIWGSPLVAEKRIYIADEGGVITVLPLSEKLESPLARNLMGRAVHATPVAANSILFVPRQDRLFAIESNGDL